MGRQRQKQRKRQQTAKRQADLRPQPVGFGKWSIAAVVAVLLAAIGLIVYAATRPASPTTSESATSVARAESSPVDGIPCNQGEQLAYHIHEHLALYDHGKQVQVPSDIGIPGTVQCYYWIHVHETEKNIVHVESPVHKLFTLGNFFDIWQNTSATAIPVGDAYVRTLIATPPSQVRVFLNGKRWTHGYRAVPLKDHEVITVEAGPPYVKPKPFSAWQGL